MSTDIMARLEEMSRTLRELGMDALADALEAGEDIEEALVRAMPKEVRL